MPQKAIVIKFGHIVAKLQKWSFLSFVEQQWWIPHLHRISWVFGSRFMALGCLLIRFMPLFLLLRLVCLFWEICRFWLCETICVSIIKIFGPCETKKKAKEAQRHAAQTNSSRYHDPEGSTRSNETKIDRASEPEATTFWHWWFPWYVVAPSFSRGYLFSRVYSTFR